jgi:hypothetical protein
LQIFHVLFCNINTLYSRHITETFIIMEDFTMGDLQQAVAEYMENIDVPSDALFIGGKIYVVVKKSDIQSSYYNCVETVTSVCTLFTYIMVILIYL